MSEKTGMTTAVALAVEAYQEPEDPEQLDFLGLPEPMSPLGRELVAKRRAGRPPGARNKRTTATVDWLLRQYQDPRAVLLAIAQSPVDELAARLGCTPMEALQEKRLAAIGVLPYVAQKQPLAVDLREHKSVTLTIIDGTLEMSDDGIGLTATIIENDAKGSP